MVKNCVELFDPADMPNLMVEIRAPGTPQGWAWGAFPGFVPGVVLCPVDFIGQTTGSQLVSGGTIENAELLMNATRLVSDLAGNGKKVLWQLEDVDGAFRLAVYLPDLKNVDAFIHVLSKAIPGLDTSRFIRKMGFFM